jgi:hypothetical protein
MSHCGKWLVAGSDMMHLPMTRKAVPKLLEKTQIPSLDNAQVFLANLLGRNRTRLLPNLLRRAK